jgi:hypothetical protein
MKPEILEGEERKNTNRGKFRVFNGKNYFYAKF